MAERILTLRELNRATLSRQMLLERAALSVPQAVERLVGLQGQQALAPYVGLWTRVQDFTRDDLAGLIENHTIIKATLMRATLHLFTAEDYVRFRGTIQRVLDVAYEAIAKRRGDPVDMAKILAAGEQFIAEEPRTFAEISTMLTELMPDVDVGSMRYGLRTHLPIVQVPTDTQWSYPGNPKFTLADIWLGKSIPTEDNFRELVFRYLAAFGPASVTDIQTWSGMVKLKDDIEKLRPDLMVYRDEGKRELFDLPDMPLPEAETPAPERFLPEYDNLLLSHQKRTRVIADQFRKQVYLPGLRVRSTFLVDGFVRGGWKIERKKGAAVMLIEPFDSLTKQNRLNLTEEAEKLVRFVESDASTFEVRFTE